jgi:hypothetical protein
MSANIGPTSAKMWATGANKANIGPTSAKMWATGANIRPHMSEHKAKQGANMT